MMFCVHVSLIGGSTELVWANTTLTTTVTSYDDFSDFFVHWPQRDTKFTGLSRIGGDLLSHTWRCSTIGATALNGRVRNGAGCFARAVTTKPRQSGKYSQVNCVYWCMTIDVSKSDFEVCLLLDQIKPIGQLVPVNWVHCCTYISGLSTWWSTTALRDTLFWGGLPA